MQAVTRTYRGREDKVMFYAITLSLLLHVSFFVLFVVLPEFSGDRYRPPDTINVMIIPGGGGSPAPVNADIQGGASQFGNAPVAPVEKQPETTKPLTPVESVYIPPSPVETVTPSVYTAPKPEEVVMTKPVEPVVEPPMEVAPATTENVKTFAPQSSKPSDATKKVEQALQQMNQATQRSDSAVQETQGSRESVNSAIEQLRQKNAAQSAGGGGTGTGGGTGSGTGTGTGPGAGPGVAGPVARYLAAVQSIIEKNWSFAPALYNGPANAEVLIEVTITAEGKIIDTRYLRKSGNSYLDDSAMNAVLKSHELPPFKVYDLNLTHFKQTFRFTPKGLSH